MVWGCTGNPDHTKHHPAGNPQNIPPKWIKRESKVKRSDVFFADLCEHIGAALDATVEHIVDHWQWYALAFILLMIAYYNRQRIYRAICAKLRYFIEENEAPSAPKPTGLDLV